MYALEIFATKVLTTCKQSEPEKPGFFLSKPGLEPEPGFWKKSGLKSSLIFMEKSDKTEIESDFVPSYNHNTFNAENWQLFSTHI